jgi:hypothetical protein
MNVFSPFGGIPKIEIAELYGNDMFKFLKSYQTVFHSRAIPSQIPASDNYIRVPHSLYP